ncbi:MFS transporter [Legionella dresdenensis]|uniref:MFS transporter n=1 Tax=Legionella dresdenensis TaxID=450200 RepID=A0ABV8CEM8_9GAMM
MKSTWSNSVFPIAALFSFRMLGLFMLIPVFSVLAEGLSGATPALIGIALGSYGLSQGILQMPFGLWSDRYGRKKMITIGLTLFAIGSLVGALTHSIYGMIIARILQGMGAVGSVLIALLADLTTEQQRTRAMAVIGMTIGMSFSLAMVISPAITHHYGLAGIFILTLFLAIAGLVLLHTVIPNPEREEFHADSETKAVLLKPVLTNKNLQRLNAGIFFQHAILTATFYAIPFLLKKAVNQGIISQQWHFYLPLMIFSFIAMLPLILLAEKMHKTRVIFLATVGLTALCQFLLAFYNNAWPAFCLLMTGYFIAFNFLEANLPSLISRQADKNSKGTAIGVYSTCQFLGIFAGGSAAGLLYQLSGINGIFFANAALGLIWLIIALTMRLTKA